MKKIIYRGCEILMTNESKLISDDNAVNFCEEYIYRYLSNELGIIPKEVKKKEAINVSLCNDKRHIKIYLNDILHIVLNIKGFHNAQLVPELFSGIQGSFFTLLHSYKYSGIDITDKRIFQ